MPRYSDPTHRLLSEISGALDEIAVALRQHNDQLDRIATALEQPPTTPDDPLSVEIINSGDLRD